MQREESIVTAKNVAVHAESLFLRQGQTIYIILNIHTYFFTHTNLMQLYEINEGQEICEVYTS